LTEFEYFTGAILIVLALTIARCLDAIPASFEPGRRYWVHFVWLCIKLANPVVLLWAMWLIRDLQQLSFLSLVGGLSLSAMLYLQVIALVSTSPDSVVDWRSHYYSKHRLFFGVNTLFLILLSAGTQLTSGPFGANPITLVQGVMIALSCVAMVTARPRLHESVAVVAALNMFVALFGILTASSRAA
jgi:hypothetical protein